MAKGTGLGQAFFVGGYSGVFALDLSGDTGSIDQARGGPELEEVTGIDKLAKERIGLRRDGAMDWTAFYNPSSGQAHPTYAALPTGNVITLWQAGTGSVGDPVFAINGKQPDYALRRAANGSIRAGVGVLANGYGAEWCQLYHPKATDASAANGTAIDGGTQGTAMTVTGASAANPTVVTTSAPHGLVTGDSVLIAGTDKAALNGNRTVTVTGASTFTVPVDLSGGAASAGTATKTSTNFGASAYVLGFSIASGTLDPALQDSADNTTFAAISSMTFTGFTNADTSAQRVQSTATAIIRRYTRMISGNTFSNGNWVGAAIRHLSATL